MDEKIAPHPLSLWRRILPPLVVIASLGATCAILFAAMELVTSHYDAERAFLKNDRPPTAFEVAPAISMEYAARSRETNDVIFFGDSTCSESMQAVRFQQHTGLKAYTIGSMGVLGIRGFALEAQVYLLNHPPPRLMVLCVYPTELILPPSHWGVKQDDVRDRFFRAYGNGVISRSPLETIRQGILITWGNLNGGLDWAKNATMAESRDSYNDVSRQVAAGRGYMEFPKTDHPNLSPDQQPTLTGISEEARDGIETVARLTGERGIKFMIRLTPVWAGDQPDMEGEKFDWISGLETKYPNLTVSRPLIVSFDRSRMGDRFHCNGKGAREFTDLVTAQVQTVLARK